MIMRQGGRGHGLRRAAHALQPDIAHAQPARAGAAAGPGGRHGPGRIDQGAQRRCRWHAVTLTKVVTTVGKPGVQVASITKRPNGYVLAHVEGALRPSINGVALVTDTAPLSNGDLIELAGTQMQFVHA
jgi:hypothetical protein